MIDAVIFVERDSQKAIVVGKGGQRIRTVDLDRQRLQAAASLQLVDHSYNFV